MLICGCEVTTKKRENKIWAVLLQYYSISEARLPKSIQRSHAVKCSKSTDTILMISTRGGFSNTMHSQYRIAHIYTTQW